MRDFDDARCGRPDSHLNDTHGLSFGERDGSLSARAESIATTLSGTRFESRLSKTILQEMWEKWVFIAATAGITCLMRASVGDVIAANAVNLTTTLLDECSAIAASQGFAPGEATLARSRTMLTTPGSAFAASMLRDIERGAPIEADHVIGDLHGAAWADASLLRIAYAHLKAYEARRMREQTAAKAT